VSRKPKKLFLFTRHPSLFTLFCIFTFYFLLPNGGPQAAFAAKGGSTNEPVICRDGFVEVVSPDNVSAAECKKATQLVRVAWNFDLSIMRWADQRALNRSLTLRLFSAERMKNKYRGFRASASNDGKRFTMNLKLVDDKSGPLTCAHELGHVQASRTVGKRWGKHAIPLYFIEGHGLILNRLYADHLRLTAPKDWAGNVGVVMSMSADEVRIILTDGDRYCNYEKDPDKTNRMEYIGVYFVEYMRTRYGGRGIPDMVPKMGRVFELVGHGMTYGKAFKQVYGVSAGQVASEIVALFKRTEANPVERYRETRFEAAAKIAAGKKK
jgi:hypothetical protein